MKKEHLLLLLFLLCFATLPASAQKLSREIMGIVKDDLGDPLLGVTITTGKAKQSRETTTTVTDVNGHFKLSMDNSVTAIEVRYIGFKTKIIRLTQEDSYEITLDPDTKTVQEVVVNGVFTRKSNTFTGAVTTVSGDDLSRV